MKRFVQAEEHARAGAARRDLHRARRGRAARRGGLAQEGRRHGGQGPGQVRLLLGLQHGQYIYIFATHVESSPVHYILITYCCLKGEVVAIEAYKMYQRQPQTA